MFAFFFDLGVPSVYRIDGKLINNFASDAFLGELVSLISSLCPDLKPKIYRETPLWVLCIRRDLLVNENRWSAKKPWKLRVAGANFPFVNGPCHFEDT